MWILSFKSRKKTLRTSKYIPIFFQNLKIWRKSENLIANPRSEIWESRSKIEIGISKKLKQIFKKNAFFSLKICGNKSWNLLKKKIPQMMLKIDACQRNKTHVNVHKYVAVRQRSASLYYIYSVSIVFIYSIFIVHL